MSHKVTTQSKTGEANDPINPNHYKQGRIETIEAIEAALGQEGFKGYLTGNILKYVWRYRNKNGLEDLKKAQWYLNRLISQVESEADKNV